MADIVYALPGHTASQFKKTLLVMNRDGWDALDADTQAALEEMTGKKMSEGGHVTTATAGVKSLEKWAAEGGEIIVDGVSDYRIPLPESGDYLICVGSIRGNASYTLTVTIE